MHPILLPPCSVNQRLPSGPAVIPSGPLPYVGRGNSVIMPLVLMRPILLPSGSVNQRLPSGPAVIPHGPLADVGTGNSVMFPAGVVDGVWRGVLQLWENAHVPLAGCSG